MIISVIIPTYKPGGYIWECLGSLGKQDFAKDDFEIIIVLNGCNEPYHSQISRYINEHMAGCQVNFLQTDKPGVSNARNMALDVAKGEYITFIDDDDYVSPTFLSGLYKAVNSDIVSLCRPLAFIDGKEGFVPYRITKAFDALSIKGSTGISKARKFFSGPCMKLIPTSFIQGRRFDVRFHNSEDTIFMFLISDRIHSVSFASADAVYYRRIRNDSAMTRRRKLSAVIANDIRVLKEIINIYCKTPRSYSFTFFITRLLGRIKGTLVSGRGGAEN